ncbi:MAG: hypothetical protein N3D18_02950 [Roseococcus sp.]|nr:hypothetical protein [Roseococcus sp.]
MEARDSDPLRRDPRDRGAVSEIPPKRNCHLQHGVSRPLGALRGRIARFINRLKNSRRVATRSGRTADGFLGFAALSSSRPWIIPSAGGPDPAARRAEAADAPRGLCRDAKAVGGPPPDDGTHGGVPPWAPG